MSQAIKASLDGLKGQPRTHIGFITFDSAVHFYSLKASLKQPRMLVVAESEEPFLPASLALQLIAGVLLCVV